VKAGSFAPAFLLEDGMTRAQRWLLVLILLLAAAVRFTGLDWDGYEHYHPDERYITWVATTIEWPDSWATAFVPERASWNPFYWPPEASSEGIQVPQGEPRDFAYGHFPLYLGVAATRVLEKLAPLATVLPDGWLLTRDLLNGAGRGEFDHLAAAARATTALIDTLTVLVVFLLGRQLYGLWAGLLASLLSALTVLHIQLAHFFAVDPYLTLFSTAALLFLVVATRRPGAWQPVVLASAMIGLAVGAKFTAVLLFLPLAVALWGDRTLAPRQAAGRFLALAVVSSVVFAVTNPFAVLDWTCQVVTPQRQIGPLTIPALNWGNCYLENVVQQSAMVRGSGRFPFTRQYAETAAFAYPVVQQVRWGMGPLLGLAAFAGGLWVALRWASGAVRERIAERWRGALAAVSGGELVVLSFVLPYFVINGSFYVKFMRYMQPLLPLLAVFGAGLIAAAAGRWRRGALAVAVLVVAATALYAAAFVGLYEAPHPWVAASRWLHENVAERAAIAGEKWDEALPSTVEIGGERLSRSRFVEVEVDWLGGVGARDDEDKLRKNFALLAATDYVVVASNRSYGVAGRLPGLYPLTRAYYEKLFGGELGYEVVFASGRAPQLGGTWLWPDRFGYARLTPPDAVARYLDGQRKVERGYADESFTVYDQPLVMVFENQGRLSAAEMMAVVRGE
jgi:hypothetical protein